MKGHAEVCTALIDKGAEVNATHKVMMKWSVWGPASLSLTFAPLNPRTTISNHSTILCDYGFCSDGCGIERVF